MKIYDVLDKDGEWYFSGTKFKCEEYIDSHRYLNLMIYDNIKI